MTDYVDDCIFCKIAKGEIPCEMVDSTDNVMAFKDIAPSAPVHVLIVPRTHVQSAQHLGSEHDGLWQEMLELAQSVATQTGVDETGYRLVTNIGKEGGQEVPHLHMHLLGGRQMRSIG